MVTLERAPLATIAVLLFAVGLNGCVWVSQQTFDDHVACLDEDNDSFVARTTCPDLAPGEQADCDETRADRNPAQDELGTPAMWYDGIDQDCDGEDVIDQDGDNYPGILQADWDLVVDHLNLNWPTELNAEFDCDDLEPTTYFASPAEAPYDGVDSDCGAEDDWDFDGDGHVPPPACLPLGAATYTGSLPQDDCDDTDPEVFPGTTKTDEWYDGIDHDCAGNNDYDRDGDGYIEDVYISDYNLYVQQCGQTDDRTIGDDCDDDPSDNGGQPVGAAAVNPGATETWYDGVDQDCVADSDYDKDHDTYECDGSVVSACTGHLGDDCDDETSTIHPTALEKVGDAIDQDCDTLDDGAPFQFSSFSWTGPSVPVLDATDRHYLLSVVAEEFEDLDSLSDPAPNPGLVLTFDPAVANSSGLVTTKVWFNGLTGQQQPIGDGVALTGEADRLFVASALFKTANNINELRLQRADWSESSNNYSIQLHSANTTMQRFESPFDLDHQDFDIIKDTSDQYWAAACGTHAIQFAVAKDGAGFPTPAVEDVEAESEFLENAGFIACYLEPVSATLAVLHTYGTSGHVEYDLAVGGTSPGDGSITECVPNGRSCTDDSNSYDVLDVNQRDGLLVFTEDDGVTVWSGPHPDNGDVIWGPFLGTETIVSADAWLKDDGTLFIAAVVVDADDPPNGTDVVLLYGDPTDPPDTLDPNVAQVEDRILFHEHPDMTPDPEPDAVSIFVDDDRIFIAVSGFETAGDTVGWVFMGHQ
ncbi:MAG: hypothetical protein JRJ84_22945 [Deltaproteobacteria bacterium]|nr:hypothetical protein [Deltaproteobacteria bacterium]